MKSVLNLINSVSAKTEDWALLAMRLTLAYGFYDPAVGKFSDISGKAEWFASMHYPLPTLSVLLVGALEFVGFFLLMLGFFTRYISIPLMFIMLLAILTVHLGNGFSAAGGGFEVPLYYLVMLFVLFSKGPGRYSIDEAIVNKV